MLTNTQNITIDPKPATDIENYEWLRNAGLNYIQQFSGKLWTDYNIHDPGITMLELLCYALTDISYRLSFPVQDILTAPGDKSPDVNDFFTARKILTTHPVTINDYRKLLLDHIPSIRNIWLETLDAINYEPTIYYDKKDCVATLKLADPSHPYEILQLKGLYIVKLDVEDYETILAHHPNHVKTLAQYRDKDSTITDEIAQPGEYKSCILNYARTILLNSRNLSEDFEVVKLAKEEFVAVCADIELKPDANADDVFTEIYSVLYNYINPAMQLYSFKEMLNRGKRTEDIFNGPIATRGFIDDDVLDAHGHKEVLYVSDIINLLMNIDGILQIKTIHLSSYTKDESTGTYTILKDAQMYCLHLDDVLNDVFQFVLDAGEQDPTKVFNHIRFSKGLIYFTPERKASYVNQNFIDYPDVPDDFQNDLKVPAGKNRNLTNYYSIQNDLPLTYYTGMDGVPNSVSNLRKAQRLQTKAYLLFFDQMLADYLSLLNNVKNVFTWRGSNTKPIMPAFHLDSTMIKDLRKLLKSEHAESENISDDLFFKTTYDDYDKDLATNAINKSRYNKALDHLMARFNEVFVDYTVFKFQQNKEGNFFNQSDLTQIIADKVNFLKLYPIISSRRSHAFNYTKSVYATDNLSGLQLRIQKMMGINSTQNVQMVSPIYNINYKTFLANVASENPPPGATKITIYDNRFSPFETTFGIHVLEHILLRPLYKADFGSLTTLLPLCGDGKNNQHADCLLPDYFSHQITVVLPGWLSISCNMDFRAFTENLIRSEAPAHVAIKICWLDPARMYLFEKTTQVFFDAMAVVKAIGYNATPADITAFNIALQDVYTMMGTLKNVYPPSNLDECSMINYNSDTDQINTPIILNYSALGASEDEEWFTYKALPAKNTKPVS